MVGGTDQGVAQLSGNFSQTLSPGPWEFSYTHKQKKNNQPLKGGGG